MKIKEDEMLVKEFLKRYTEIINDEEPESFTIIIGDYEKEIKVIKDGNKWLSSDGKSFNGNLEPDDVVLWIRSDYGKVGTPYSIKYN